MVPPSKGTPSTTNNGCELPLMVFTPRITMLVPEPDRPLVAPIFTPGALPLKTRPRSPSGRSSKSFLPTEDTAYPKAFFSRLIPKAVTTTSLRFSSAVFKETFPASEAATSFFSNPVPEITKTAPGLTVSLKTPLASVAVPPLLFFSTTAAPSMGFPLSSVTFPVTVVVCARPAINAKIHAQKLSSSFFLMLSFLGLLTFCQF